MDTTVLAEYVSYLRKSNGRKPIPRQRSLTETHVRGLGGRITREFVDADRTAFRKTGDPLPERKDFTLMLAMLAANPGLGVAAWHADRLTRDPEATEALIQVCAAGRNPVETYSGGRYDLWTATGRKRLRDDSNTATYEVDHNRERVLAGRLEVAQEGRWLGGKRPFGWEPVPDPVDEDGEPLLDCDDKPVKGILRLVPREAEALGKAHHDVLGGATLAAIARAWNAAGLTGTQGQKWQTRDVGRVLRRPRNAGLMEYQAEITGAASWPPVVDETTWRAVAAVLNDPARRTTTGPARKHLLSGLATCGYVTDGKECGGPVLCTLRSGKNAPLPVYRCREGSRGHVARSEAAVDDFVIRLVVARLSRDDAADLLKQDHRGELAALRREAEALRILMREANDLRVEGLLTKAEFASGRLEHQERLATIEQKIADLGQADVLAPVIVRFREEAPADYEGRLAVWKEYPLDTRRAVVDTLMTVTILPARQGRIPGWRPGQPYFDPESVRIDWKRE